MSEITHDKKTAIILFNLGGPDSVEAVKPFLFNLFYDKYIITLPAFFRYIIAWIISTRREKTAQKIYAYTGNRSPILPETVKQKEAIETILKKTIDSSFEIFICMRHWHPMSDEVAKNVKEYDPDEIIFLPLYPQFSTTTTASSFEDFESALKKHSVNKPILKKICCYFSDTNFIIAHTNLIKDELKKLEDQTNYRILFSAHGLPKRIIESGDPYQWQVEYTVKNIVDKLNIENLDYKISYQSRVGPLEWIGPNTEEEIHNAGSERKNLIIVPIAFTSEHVETLVELDIEYQNIAKEHGIEYLRVPAVGTNRFFIESLATIVVNFMKSENNLLYSHNFNRICPEDFQKCPCKFN